jgi:hypothetical protein
MVNQLIPVASRDLKPNHRLADRDLKQSSSGTFSPGTVISSADLLKKYLLVSKSGGDSFQTGDVSDSPSFSYADKYLLSIPIPTTHALNGQLEPGTIVDVYGFSKAATTPTALLKGATVEAVLDSGTSGDLNCVLVLALMPGTVADAALALAGATELFIVAHD